MLTFNALWQNHPTITGDDAPCSINREPKFANQCAIRMGVCLTRCGIDTTTIPGVRHCWFSEHGGHGHTLSAENLANSLKSFPIDGVGMIRAVEPSDFSRTLSGQTGILFFKDYWQRTVNNVRESFRHRSGDHIDLWNGSRLTDWSTWIRIQMGLSIGGYWADYAQSKEIWFWQVM